MKCKNILTCFAAVLVLTLSACSSKTIAPGDYDSSEVGKIKKVVPGVIISKRPVRIHSQVADSTSTAIDNNTTAATNNDDNALNRSHGFEYVIRLNSGAIISLVQTEDLNLQTKQHILVIYGKNTRVVADDGSDDY
jgi:outer membrane lipoprotein SlyB